MLSVLWLLWLLRYSQFQEHTLTFLIFSVIHPVLTGFRNESNNIVLVCSECCFSVKKISVFVGHNVRIIPSPETRTSWLQVYVWFREETSLYLRRSQLAVCACFCPTWTSHRSRGLCPWSGEKLSIQEAQRDWWWPSSPMSGCGRAPSRKCQSRRGSQWIRQPWLL